MGGSGLGRYASSQDYFYLDFDASNVWELFYQNFESFLPLRNVGIGVAKTSSLPASPRTQYNSFPSVSIQFEPYSADSFAAKDLFSLHNKPLVHVFLASCEDIDAYRAQVRPKLISWLEAMPNRRTLKLIVVLIETSTFTVDTSKSNKAFLADKIRFDFSDKATLNIVTLRHQNEGLLSNMNDFVGTFSSCFHLSANAHLEFMDEEIRKMDLQRTLPGWNYCKFFLVKEEKILLLLSLGMNIEAMISYDELEATLFDILDSSTESDSTSFTSILPPRELIAGSDLYDIDSKPYRHMMQRSEISLYEFGVYLFSSQSAILIQSGMYEDFLKRCKRFICSFVALNSVSKHRRSIWIFDAVIATCKLLQNTCKDIVPYAREVCDLLLLADLQISTSSLAIHTNDFNKKLDFNHLSFYSELERFGTIAEFKLYMLNWCCSVLKDASHEKMVALSRLSNLLFELEQYELVFKKCQSLNHYFEQRKAFEWVNFHVKTLELLFKSALRVERDKEFVEAAFEYMLVCSESGLDSSDNMKLIEAGLLGVKEDVRLDFTKFFFIESLVIADDHFIRLKLNSFCNLSQWPMNVKLTMSGERKDVCFASESVKLFATSNYIEFVMDKSQSGLLKFSSLSLSAGKFSWLILAAELERTFEVNIDANQDIVVSCSAAPEFNFTAPVILIDCTCTDGIKIVNMEAHCPEFQLTPINDSNLSGEDLFKFSASRYVPGKHKIKISIDNIDSDGLKMNRQIWSWVQFPQLWEVDTKIFSVSENTRLASFKIKSSFNDLNVKMVSIRLDDQAEQKYEHELLAGSVINYAATIMSVPKQLTIEMMEPIDGVYKYVLPVAISEQRNIFFSCKTVEKCTKYIVQKPIELTISVSSPLSCHFEVVFDLDYWSIDEPHEGHFEGGNYNFVAIPLKTGHLLVPTLRLLDDSIKVHNLSQGATINCIEE